MLCSIFYVILLLFSAASAFSVVLAVFDAMLLLFNAIPQTLSQVPDPRLISPPSPQSPTPRFAVSGGYRELTSYRTYDVGVPSDEFEGRLDGFWLPWRLFGAWASGPALSIEPGLPALSVGPQP